MKFTIKLHSAPVKISSLKPMTIFKASDQYGEQHTCMKVRSGWAWEVNPDDDVHRLGGESICLGSGDIRRWPANYLVDEIVGEAAITECN